jgi:altronate hydrolase
MLQPERENNVSDLLLKLHPADDVLIARTQLISGQQVGDIKVRGMVPAGHKVAARNIAALAPVLRYNQIIGFASKAIQAGEHVHTQNLDMGSTAGAFERDYAIGADCKPAQPRQEASFMGYVRKDGRVATRNYIGILSSVNCSATVARAIADHFRHAADMRDFPNVDGVVALTHGTGCGMASDGEGIDVLRRTLTGYAVHPNFAGVLVVGLGCESNQIVSWMRASGLSEGVNLRTFNIQNVGGTRAAVEQGIATVQAMLVTANEVRREPCSVSHLVVGLQCGGSDGYSGISANPALGAAVDRLVAHGGTAILSETPEVYKLLDRIKWWESYTLSNGGEMNNNPSPGNKAGGLTTILEKSLGAVAKGGTTNLVAVYKYAELVDTHGFVFMDTPGYDPVSATGQVAGGANLICFTTGRGSAYGCAPSPSLKVATNTALWQKQSDDMDINCGEIVDGLATVDELGEQIFQALIALASGSPSKSEMHGYGQSEFVPWQLGAVM